MCTRRLILVEKMVWLSVPPDVALVLVCPDGHKECLLLDGSEAAEIGYWLKTYQQKELGAGATVTLVDGGQFPRASVCLVAPNPESLVVAFRVVATGQLLQVLFPAHQAVRDDFLAA